MELRHLRYFVAVAAHGSFNRAAEILHLTQPTLSRQVKDLEEELDVPLLVRGQNTVKLTEAGELFYEEAREVIARADEAARRSAKRDSTRRLRSLNDRWRHARRFGKISIGHSACSSWPIFRRGKSTNWPTKDDSTL